MAFDLLIFFNFFLVSYWKSNSIRFFYLILSLSSAAITIGEKGCSKAVLVPVSNLVSQLAIWLCSLLTAETEKALLILKFRLHSISKKLDKDYMITIMTNSSERRDGYKRERHVNRSTLTRVLAFCNEVNGQLFLIFPSSNHLFTIISCSKKWLWEVATTPVVDGWLGKKTAFWSSSRTQQWVS